MLDHLSNPDLREALQASIVSFRDEGSAVGEYFTYRDIVANGNFMIGDARRWKNDKKCCGILVEKFGLLHRIAYVLEEGFDWAGMSLVTYKRGHARLPSFNENFTITGTFEDALASVYKVADVTENLECFIPIWDRALELQLVEFIDVPEGLKHVYTKHFAAASSMDGWGQWG